MKIQDSISEYGHSQGKSYNDVIQSKVIIREFLEELYFSLHAVLRDHSHPKVGRLKKNLLKKLQAQFFGADITSQIRKILS